MENRWKVLVRKSLHRSRFVKELFPEGVLQFRDHFENGFFPTNDDMRTITHTKKRASYKCALFCEEMLKYMLSNRQHFPFFSSRISKNTVTLNDFITKIQEINPDEIFFEIVKICMKNAYAEGIDIQHKDKDAYMRRDLGDDCLKTKRSDIQYPITEYLAMYLFVQVLEVLSEKELLINNTVDQSVVYLKIIASHIRPKMKDYDFHNTEGNSWAGYPDDVTYVFLQFLAETEVVLRVEKEQKLIRSGKISDVIVYVFNRKLDSSLGWSENLPRITPPQKASIDNCVKEWISPVKGGSIEVEVSRQARRSLNIQQEKKFKINSEFLDLIEKRNNTSISYEISTSSDYSKADEIYQCWMWSKWSSSLNNCLYNGTKVLVRAQETEAMTKAKKLGKETLEEQNWKNVSHSDLVVMCGMSYAEAHVQTKKFQMHDEVSSIRGRRQLIATNGDIGKIFDGFPLYFSTKLDYRFRMYPGQYLLSRVTGFLKYTLQDFQPTLVKNVGLRNMLEAYYMADPTLLEKFLQYKSVITNDKSKKKLKTFFFENRLKHFDKIPMYFELLDTEIQKLFNAKSPEDKKTGLALEIDQVGSGPMLVAILTGNKKLAEKCNMMPGETHCIYSYVQEESYSYLKMTYPGFCGEDADEALLFLKNNRDAQKRALMCFFYKQRHQKRTKKLKEQFEELLGRAVTDPEYTLLSIYSVKYDKFISEIFPGLNEQLALLEEAMLLLVNNHKEVKIHTLDDCILTWDFGHFLTKKRNSWNPITQKSEKYSLSLKCMEKGKQSARARRAKHVRTFRANLVHSIDAALMRFFINESYNRTGRRINHLHDCLLCHPNDVDAIFDIIRDVYCRPNMKKMATNLVFNSFISITRGEIQEQIIRIEKEFNSKMENLDFLNVRDFDARRCYKYEKP
jgi:hypothetical protein